MKLLYVFFFLLSASWSWAQTALSGTASANNILVVSQPNMNGQPLTMLRQGQPVLVLGRSADAKWLKISVPQSGGPMITGWVMRSSVALSQSQPARAPAPRPTVPQQPSYTSPTYRPTPPAYQPPPPAYRPPPSSSAYATRGSGNTFVDQWLSKRLHLAAGLSYLLYDQRVSTRGTSPSELFSYRSSGLGLGLDIDYQFYEMMNGNLLFGSQLGFVYGMYSTKTALKDQANPPAQFKSVTAKSSSLQFDFRVNAAYKLPFGREDQRPTAGVSLGYQMFSFNGDDIQTSADNVTNITTTPDGDPDALGMYIPHTSSGILLGLFGNMPLGELDVGVGLDFIVLPSYSESPGNGVKTGDSPSPGMAMMPSIRGRYRIMPGHFVTLAYDLRMQSVDFSGAGQRVTNNLTDGQTKALLHQLSLGYSYAF